MTLNHCTKARRALLGVLIAATVGTAASVPTPAQAQAPEKRMSQAPGYYRMALGNIEITALYDGYTSLNPNILKGASQENIRDLLDRMFVPISPEGVQTDVNGFLVNTGEIGRAHV